MELWEHQKIAIAKARLQPNLALFFEPGLGKTGTVINCIRDKFNEKKRHRSTLIVAPLIVTGQWKEEFKRFSKIPSERIVVLNQSGAKRVKEFSYYHDKFKGEFIAITNYEAFLTKEFTRLVTDWQPEIVVLDESHRVKNPSSQRVQALKPICKDTAHCYLMTGTPVLNTPMDLFTQYLLMDKGATFGTNFYAFRALYFYDANAHMPKQKYFPNWKIRKDASDKIARLLAATSVQAKAKDCLDLPPLVQTELTVTMGKDQEKAYRELEKTFITFVQDKVVTAQLAITKTLRMRQCLAGFLLPDGDEDGERDPIYFKDNPRLDALVEKVSDLCEAGKKSIIWTDFVPTYDMIAKALEKAGIKSVFMTGRESIKQKEENKNLFLLGDVGVAICNPAAVGLGVNLTEAPFSHYYTRSYNQEHAEQSLRRNYRGGSEMHEFITHYGYSVPKTIDQAIIDSLSGKTTIAEAVLAWGRSGQVE